MGGRSERSASTKQFGMLYRANACRTAWWKRTFRGGGYLTVMVTAECDGACRSVPGYFAIQRPEMLVPTLVV
ncbi:hypothetical protein C8K30_103266 [Promicromonospora sp. AC04]|nr:hypothetical protein C8K30_103266 [Promicromonospora sp. AC04]